MSVKRTTLQPDTSVTQPSRSVASRDLPQFFLLTWNNSKARTASQAKYIKHEAWGTKYPNGTVTLDYKLVFDSMFDLKTHFAEFGDYAIQPFKHITVKDGE